jgi:hypothetical protein
MTKYQVSFIVYYPYRLIPKAIFNTLKEANTAIKSIDDRLKWRFLVKRIKVANET